MRLCVWYLLSSFLLLIPLPDTKAARIWWQISPLSLRMPKTRFKSPPQVVTVSELEGRVERACKGSGADSKRRCVAVYKDYTRVAKAFDAAILDPDCRALRKVTCYRPPPTTAGTHASRSYICAGHVMEGSCCSKVLGQRKLISACISALKRYTA